MADSREESEQSVMTAHEEPTREPWPEEDEERSKRARARSYFRQHPVAKWLLLFFIVLVIVGGIVVWRYYAIRETTDDAQIDGHIGAISPRVGGTVTGVFVEDNTYVHSGDLLVRLDPKDYDVAVQRAEADLADAEASAKAAHTGVPVASTTTTSQTSTAQANLNSARKQVDVARAREREAEANFNKVAQDLKRYQLLVQKEEISQQQYDAAVAASQGAQATLDATRAAVATAESQVAQAQALLRQSETGPQQIQITRAKAGAADAQVQRAQAALEQAKLNRGYTEIRAPFDGVVDKRNVEPGQVVSPGQPMFSLVDVNSLWVTANFKETQLKEMRERQTANIHVDAFDQDVKGHVDSMGGATGARFSLLPPENATGNFVKVVQRVPIRILIEKGEDPQHRLRPGMSVEATVITK